MSPQLKTFLATVGGLATKLPGAPPVLIIVRDPDTRIVSFMGTPNALNNMKPEIVAKCAPEDEQNVGVTGWEG